MAANRRSRTDCDTFSDVPRDHENLSTAPQRPVLPLIESSDHNSLFKWARNMSLALDEWAAQVGNVVNQDNDAIQDLYTCYCFSICSGWDCEWMQNNMPAIPAYILVSGYNASPWAIPGASGAGSQLNLGRLSSSNFGNPSMDQVTYSTPAVTDGFDYAYCEGSSLINSVNTGGGNGRTLALSFSYDDAGNLAPTTLFNDHTVGGVFFAPFSDGGHGSGEAMIQMTAVNNTPGGWFGGYGIRWNPDSGFIRYGGGVSSTDRQWVIQSPSMDKLRGFNSDGSLRAMAFIFRVWRTEYSASIEVWLNGEMLWSATQDEYENGSPLTTYGTFGLDDGDVVGTRGWNVGFEYLGDLRYGDTISSWTFLADGGLDCAYWSDFMARGVLRNSTNYEGSSAAWAEGQALVFKGEDSNGNDLYCPEYILPNDGAVGDVLVLEGPSPHDVIWAENAGALPSGGKENTLLAKASDDNYAYKWTRRGPTTFFNSSDPDNTDEVFEGDFWVAPLL